MESYGEPGCVDCYREHCRQQAPTVWVAAVTPDYRLSSQRRDRIASRRYDFVHRSCRLFIAGSFVIGLILVPCAMSAPVKSNEEEQQQHRHTPTFTDPPFWYNPCGITSSDGSGAGFDVSMELNPPDPLETRIDSIILSARHALIQTELYVGRFVKNETELGDDIKIVHEMWKHANLTWLPKQLEYIPKELDVPLTRSYLSTLTLRETLRAVHIGMQNLAVGLEQMAYDLKREASPFANDVEETKLKLKVLLCEMSTTMDDLKETECLVSRSIMDDEYRTSPQESRSLRDWLILRQYITGLQYVVQAFEYLKSKR